MVVRRVDGDRPGRHRDGPKRTERGPWGYLQLGVVDGKDKDGDFNTLTQADRLSLFYSVVNNTDNAQTVHITVVLDGPGTARDMTLVDEDVLLGASGSPDDLAQNRFEFKIKRKDWPEGSCTLSVTGSGQSRRRQSPDSRSRTANDEIFARTDWR